MGHVSWFSVVLILAHAAAFVVVEAVKLARTETAETVEDLTSTDETMKMDTVDYVRSGAMIIGFLAVNFSGRNTWMMAEFIVSFSFGMAGFFFPEAILGYETVGKLDVIHLAFMQGYGAIMIGLGLTVYASRGSNDRSVGGSLLMSRVLGGMILIQAVIIDNMKARGDKQRWNDQHLSFGGLGMGLWTFGALYQYLCGPSFGNTGIDLSQRLTKHLLFDLMAIMPIALLYYAFPEIVLSLFTMKGYVPDAIHAHLIRLHGGLIFVAALHCYSAMGFTNDIDKRAHIVGRFVSGFLVIPTICLYQYKYTIVTSEIFACSMLLQVVLSLNLLCAYYIRPKSKTQ